MDPQERLTKKDSEVLPVAGVIIKPVPVGEPHRLFHLVGRLPLGCMYANWPSHPSVCPKASQKEISRKYCACTCGANLEKREQYFQAPWGSWRLLSLTLFSEILCYTFLQTLL